MSEMCVLLKKSQTPVYNMCFIVNHSRRSAVELALKQTI